MKNTFYGLNSQGVRKEYKYLKATFLLTIVLISFTKSPSFSGQVSFFHFELLRRNMTLTPKTAP